MRTLRSELSVRIETVTSTFVAAGTPVGIHDLGRLLENLNNPALGHHIELRDATLRPLYRGGRPLQLDAPVVVRRDEVIFANFDGPHFTRGTVRPPSVEAPVLLLAPPFQIRGTVSVSPEADRTQALGAEMLGFFVVRDAMVYDADGNELGEGEQIIVNGAAVQMVSATALYIAAPSVRPAVASGRVSAAEEAEEREERASAGAPRAA
jgi:hypothetical protein